MYQVHGVVPLPFGVKLNGLVFRLQQFVMCINITLSILHFEFYFYSPSIDLLYLSLLPLMLNWIILEIFYLKYI